MKSSPTYVKIDHNLMLITDNDHHERGQSLEFSDTTTMIPPLGTFAWTVDLAKTHDYVVVHLKGDSKKKCCIVVCYANINEALAFSTRGLSTTDHGYGCMYSAQAGDTYLSIDSMFGSFIILKSARLVGTNLELIFYNSHTLLAQTLIVSAKVGAK